MVSLAGSGTVTTGRGLPVGGTQNQVSSVNANTGPNALLAAANYPVPANPSSGPLTLAALPGGQLFWRIDGSQTTLQNNWAGLGAAYVYNNSASNHGGIVGAGGAVIDGYPVNAGTYVYQFLDLSLGTLDMLAGGPDVMFRGCRLRAPATSPGFFNSQSGNYAKTLYCHYCDFGGAGSSSECDIAVQIAQAGGLRMLRNYISWIGSAIQAESGITGYLDIIENLIEDTTLYNATLHLNGIKLQGGNANALILRNSVIFDRTDSLGNQVTQTDPIGMIPTDGAFPGNGLNSDGTQGYTVSGNITGGGGYCYYLGSSAGNSPVSNLRFTDNLITASQYPAGGANGTTTFAPPSGWGAQGNAQSGNTWADGASAGQSYL